MDRRSCTIPSWRKQHLFLWRVMAIWSSPLWATVGLSVTSLPAALWLSPVVLVLLVHLGSSALRRCPARILCTALVPIFLRGGPLVGLCWKVPIFRSWISVAGLWQLVVICVRVSSCACPALRSRLPYLLLAACVSLWIASAGGWPCTCMSVGTWAAPRSSLH
jgi:hypothetical protein